MSLTRRELMSTVAAGSVLLAAGDASAGDKGKAPGALPTPLGAGQHEVKPLPFDAKKLSGISEKMITSHHDNNYTAAVKNLNKVETELGNINKDTPGYLVAGLRERELTYTNSLILHEHYFGNLGGSGGASGAIEKMLARSFGSLGRFEETFKATAMSLGGGSGWVVLDFNFHTGDLRVYGSGGHSQALAFGAPLLVLDMFEHAYAIDYGAAHAKYIDAFFQNIDWEEVNARADHAIKAFRMLPR
jgi:Fe-Mn family superoxide dismutase